jgi:sensor histidine kinase YesM
MRGMQKLLLILIFIFFIIPMLFAQGDSIRIFHLSNIPSDGVLLNYCWKFNAGDNIDWAKPDFDDKKWQTIDPTKDAYDLPQVKEPGIGWFRLHLKVDSITLKESLSLLIEQTGASEIYLNGNNIYTLGKVSSNQKEVKPYEFPGTPVSIQFDKNPFQVLAVRYAYKKNMPYFIFAGRHNHCLAITVNNANQATKQTSESRLGYIPDALRTGLFFILFILHFALYIFYPRKRGNLFFSLFAITATITNITYMWGYNTPNTELKMYLLWITIVLFNLYHLLFLKALYVVVQNKKSFIYRILIVGFLVSIPLYFWPYHSGWILGFIILPNIILAEGVRISFLAMQRKQKGAIILIFGAVNFLILYLSFYIAYYFIPSKYLSAIFYDLTYGIGVISLPVATSVFLALEFAFTNRLLETQLTEVQKLSEQTIIQEQEKQQILSSQNQMLDLQVKDRTSELTQQKTELQKALDNLRLTQAQLIQSEKEKISAQHERKLHELEAKALRAQMNPHFIFNCMNSIKFLIQNNEQEKAILYLTTFSKLIRTVFQNSDKKEISLYDEMETCRLYTQLESMRFNDKFSFEFNIDETLDLKSIKLPALTVQPFIENAIWHGIMPKEEGGSLLVTVNRTDHTIHCIVDDDGIGREISKQNKFSNRSSPHESKGEHLTQARLNLDNLLNERNASIKIVDKADKYKKASGTMVILTFREY